MRNAWREQAGLAAVTVEHGLIDEVFADLTDPRLLSGQRDPAEAAAGRAPIELAFLQLVMRRLWEADVGAGAPVLRRSTLKALGGTHAIVAGHLDRQMDSLTKAQRATAAAMFGYLVTPSGAKIRYTAEDLAGYAQRPAAVVGDVLDALSGPDLRIIRRVPAPSGDPEAHGYEIFHDVLAAAVRGWGLRNRTAALERQSRRLGAALAGAVAAVLALLAFATAPRPLERLDLVTVDFRFGMRGVVDVDPRILLVGIDDRTLASPIAQDAVPQISRSDQARVIDAIDAGNPRAIVEAIEYRSAGDPAATGRLRSALRRARSPVVLATSRIDRAGQTTLFGDETPLNDKNSRRQLNARIGYSGFTPDRDGVLRHVREQGRQAVGFLGLPTLAVRAAELGGARIEEFPRDGAWVDYAGGPGTYPHLSLLDVRNGEVPAARFENKIVVVGQTSLAGGDAHPTPAGGGTRMSPPEIQANAIATLLDGRPLRDAPAWSAVLQIVALAIVPAALAIRSRTAVALGASVVAGVVFLAGAQIAFVAGWIVPIVAPLLALVLSAVTSQVAMRAWPGARNRVGRGR